MVVAARWNHSYLCSVPSQSKSICVFDSLFLLCARTPSLCSRSRSGCCGHVLALLRQRWLARASDLSSVSVLKEMSSLLSSARFFILLDSFIEFAVCEISPQDIVNTAVWSMHFWLMCARETPKQFPCWAEKSTSIHSNINYFVIMYCEYIRIYALNFCLYFVLIYELWRRTITRRFVFDRGNGWTHRTGADASIAG